MPHTKTNRTTQLRIMRFFVTRVGRSEVGYMGRKQSRRGEIYVYAYMMGDDYAEYDDIALQVAA